MLPSRLEMDQENFDCGFVPDIAGRSHGGLRVSRLSLGRHLVTWEKEQEGKQIGKENKRGETEDKREEKGRWYGR